MLNRLHKMAVAALQRGRRWGRSVLRFAQANRSWLVLLVLAVAVAVGVWRLGTSLDWPSLTLWEWLQTGKDGVESGSTTIRNLGLVIGGAVALLLAIWRSWVAQRQADTAQQDLMNERYQQGAEMLGSNVLSVRLGGIYNLERLAADYPEQYHIQVMKLFCTFVRVPTMYESVESRQLRISPDAGGEGASLYMPPPTREDVQAIMTAIGSRCAAGIALEKKENVTLDLHGADLSYVRLTGANLAGVNLSQVDLRHADFFENHIPLPDLSKSIPSGTNQNQARISIPHQELTPDPPGGERLRANLSRSILYEANLSGANLTYADLSGAQLMSAILTDTSMIYVNFKHADLLNSDLSGAFAFNSDFSGAQLAVANLANILLSNTKLYGTNLNGATLNGADLSTALLSEPEGGSQTLGLTQGQIDQVKVGPDSSADLAGMVDVHTGEPLVWRGMPLDHKS